MQRDDWDIKHRPTTIDGLVGNANAKAIMRGWEASRVPKLTLFTGPKGCGKTTCARIVKNMLRCADVDFHESNSADDRGIDAARHMIAQSRFAPMGGDSSVWFIDEAHSLLRLSQEAMLKMLEEPPRRSWFVMATTDPDKLLDTLLSRAAIVKLSPPTELEIAKHLVWQVAKAEDAGFTPELCKAVAAACGGCPRKAVIMSQQLAAMPEGERLGAVEHLATGGAGQAESLCKALLRGGHGYRELAAMAVAEGVEPESIRRAVLGYMGAVMLSPRTNDDTLHRAERVALGFKDPLYETGKAGLALTLMSLAE